MGCRHTIKFFEVVFLSFLLSSSTAYAQDLALDKAAGHEVLTTGAPAQPKVQKFDDWFYRCVEGAGSKSVRQCEVAQIQQVKSGEQAVTVLTLAIAPTAPKKGKGKPDLLLTAIAPLNVFLPDGLRLSAGGRDILKISYRNCNQAGCWAQQRLDQKTLAAFRKAKDAAGHFRLVNGQSVNIKFSLKGLARAIDALEKGVGEKSEASRG